MFKTMPTNPFDLFKATTDYFSAFPKTETEVKDFLTKVKSVFDAEQEKTKEMWKIYHKASTGDASINEISRANKMAKELMVSTRFAFLVAIPGTVFLLPALIEFAKEYDVDLIPDSVSKEFDLK